MLPLALTPGDPAGIGPDVCLLAARENLPRAIVAVADRALLEARARALGLDIELPMWEDGPAAHRPGVLPVAHQALDAELTTGKGNPAHAVYVLSTLRRAVRDCQDGRFHALVTGPVNKAMLSTPERPFSGHTEFLAELSGAPCPVMLLCTGSLRVALATTHVPLAQVSEKLSAERLEAVCSVLAEGLRKRFGIAHPRVLVCGLNPHAGEAGYLGREEIDLIEPVLAGLRERGLAFEGPVPADTAFTPERLAAADAVLAMYHDQGLPVLKFAGFGEAVNVTLGLPFVRTSVDHGTAYDRAGTGKANPGSMLAAIRLAAELRPG